MKYTTTNSSLLAVIKRRYNAKIYKRALALYNEKGRDEVFAYLQQFSISDVRESLQQLANEEARRRTAERARNFRHLIR